MNHSIILLQTGSTFFMQTRAHIRFFRDPHDCVFRSAVHALKFLHTQTESRKKSYHRIIQAGQLQETESVTVRVEVEL